MASSVTLKNANGGTLNLEYQGTGTGNKTLVLPEIDGGLAPLASPAFTGTPTAPTAAAGTNTEQIANATYVNTMAGGTTAPSVSHAQTGYEILANGLIKQWGITPSIAARGTAAITFPIAFTTACYNVLLTPRLDTDTPPSAKSVTASGFTASFVPSTNVYNTNDAQTCYWEAIGK